MKKDPKECPSAEEHCQMFKNWQDKPILEKSSNYNNDDISIDIAEILCKYNKNNKNNSSTNSTNEIVTIEILRKHSKNDKISELYDKFGSKSRDEKYHCGL
ncbi:hypothetical protein C2G38_2230927 [Gigaspora rosea]|uniref:Uncharacterized protein n=1 Tax=Gigaspora rosea TaxID=44941 RepID=A0A397TTF5_9GLOM|nr:hypothetical protein C2G38_2230927 [Gigaspora rosea]